MSTTALFSADYLTWKTCSLDNRPCQTIYDEKKCDMLGGVCRPHIEAYYVEVMVCLVAGIIWLIWKRATLMRLQSKPMSAWQVGNHHRKNQLSNSDDEPLSITTA
jgi:hypothetical protein